MIIESTHQIGFYLAKMSYIIWKNGEVVGYLRSLTKFDYDRETYSRDRVDSYVGHLFYRSDDSLIDHFDFGVSIKISGQSTGNRHQCQCVNEDLEYPKLESCIVHIVGAFPPLYDLRI